MHNNKSKSNNNGHMQNKDTCKSNCKVTLAIKPNAGAPTQMHDSLACSNVMNVHKLSSSLHVARGDEGSAGVDGVVDVRSGFQFSLSSGCFGNATKPKRKLHLYEGELYPGKQHMQYLLDQRRLKAARRKNRRKRTKRAFWRQRGTRSAFVVAITSKSTMTKPSWDSCSTVMFRVYVEPGPCQ